MTRYLRLATGGLVIAWVMPAHAQQIAGTRTEVSNASQAEAPDIVVTGTRGRGRAPEAAAVPIDRVDAARIEQSGFTDIGRALNFLQPSVNFARAATTATAANTKSITLRGLSPDQTLILVNGKRRHANSVLNVNNSIGRGSAGVDLDLIPESAIARIEILRDGASAQYGSDAIAGVVNIILKSDARDVQGWLQGGTTEKGDGTNGVATATLGLPVGRSGHATLTGQYRREEASNRALVDQRFGRVTYRIGDPEAEIINGAFDIAVPLGGGDVYSFGTLGHKQSNNAAGFRVPGFSAAQPNGFLPIIKLSIDDYDATLGYRTHLGSGIDLDLSQGWGYNQARFGVSNTANVSLGATSPSSFDAGAVRYQQFVTDLTLSKPLTLLSGGNIAIGGQFRHEAYKIISGEPNAYIGLGADGFSGFNPRNPTDAGRDAYAAFADLELRPVRPLLLTGAVRYDHYSDFGGRTTWRIGARYDLIQGFALRGNIGTGFKAPSLQQQFFSAVQGATSAGVLVTVGTLPVNDPAAIALGARPLKPEQSRTISAGAVATPLPGISLSGDYYRIEIKDRVALSEQLSGAAVVNVLRGAGITNFSQARFFTNAVDTTTEGFEVAAHGRIVLGSNARLNLSAGYGFFKTTLDVLRPNPVLPALPLLGTKSILLLTKGQPLEKATFQADFDIGRVGFTANVAAFGEYSGLPAINVQTFSAKTTADFGFRWRIAEALQLSAGIQNAFSAHCDGFADQALVIASTGGSFPTGEECPIGLNGRSYYARLGFRF